MFERIHNLTDTAAVTAAAHSFVELQNETLLAHEQAMRADKITEVRAENLALLGGLAALGEQLDLPDIFTQLAGGVTAQPNFDEARIRPEPFAWVPQAAAAVDKDLSITSDVRAIKGVHLEWENASLPSSTILLYQRHGGSEASRLAVVPGELEALQSADHKGRIDILLRSESAISYRYKRLMAQAQTVDCYALTPAERAQFIAEERAVHNFLTSTAAKQRTIEYEFARQVECMRPRWEATKDEFDEVDSSPKSTILSAVYKASVKRLITKETVPEFNGLFVDPDSLSDDPLGSGEGNEIFESRNLAHINEAFSEPSTRRNILGRKVKVPGGAVAELSWPVGVMTPATADLERRKIAAKLEDFYLPHLAK